jgi:uncharacterized protein
VYTPLPGDRVVVFARAPERGRVKTRLAATVGAAEALAIYRKLAEDVTRAVARGPWQLEIRCAPDEAVDVVADWLGVSGRVVPQGSGSLGERMSRAMSDHFGAGPGRLVIIGTDCPEIDATVIREALTVLEDADVVFGPALDGGYYLVGSARHLPEIFCEVPWSAADTLAVSLDRARSANLTVRLLAPRRDIDTDADWRAWVSVSSAADRQESSGGATQVTAPPCDR